MEMRDTEDIRRLTEELSHKGATAVEILAQVAQFTVLLRTCRNLLTTMRGSFLHITDGTEKKCGY